MKTVTELAREAGLHIYPEYSAAFQRFHDAAIAQYRESLLAGVGEPDYTDSALYEPTAYTRDKVAAAVAIERERCAVMAEAYTDGDNGDHESHGYGIAAVIRGQQ